MLERVWRKGSLPTVLVRMYIGAATTENTVGVPYKTKNGVIKWSRNSTPEDISRKDKNSNSERYMYLNAHSSTVYNSQDMEATWMSTDRGMHEDDVAHIYNGVLLSHLKNTATCSNMNRPREHHTKWNKPEKEKYYMISLTYGI